MQGVSNILRLINRLFRHSRKDGHPLVRFIVYSVISILLVSAGACVNQITQSREPLPDMIWPQPPDVPRIRLIQSISRPEDLNITGRNMEGFLRFLKGTKNRTIVNPYGVTSDNAGTLYIVDTFSRVVHVLNKNKGSHYTFPSSDTQLVSPIGIALDKKGMIYVSDSHDGVIKVFNRGGRNYVREIGRGLLSRPTGLAFSAFNDELLVADTETSEIVRFDTRNYGVKAVIGREGNSKGYFYKPTNVFAARDGTILVSDSLNFRIQVLSAEGTFIRAFGSAGDGPGYFSRPRGVAADSDGNIYVVDALFDNIQIFNSDGDLLLAFGSSGSGYGEFWLPSGMYIDEKDTIYVSDSYNHRIQVFQYMKDDAFVKKD